MIQFRQVFKQYATGQVALNGIDLDIASHEMVFLTGHSGAGKSTLMKIMTLMERASSGQVAVNGHDLMRMKNSAIPFLRRDIGVVFQNHQLLFDRNVFENVALPLQISGYSSREIGRRVRAALDKVGLLKKEKSIPITLSGGEQQRVGIARAVVNKPKILLADEPTGNLDPALSAEIMHLFEQFNDVGVSVMIASHDLSLVKKMDKRVITLNGGNITHDGFMSASHIPNWAQL